ncbi:MAG: hypothetical protein WCL21_19135, partial [Mariniphaga sp.]
CLAKCRCKIRHYILTITYMEGIWEEMTKKSPRERGGWGFAMGGLRRSNVRSYTQVRIASASWRMSSRNAV